MSQPFIGEIKIFSYNFAPRFWALCNGQSLAINQNQALFSLLGTTYGGNGVTTFNLPNFQGRTGISRSGSFTQGQTGGVENVTLLSTQIPAHIHPMIASTSGPAQGQPSGGALATFPSENAYSGAGTANTAMNPTANSGSSQPHPNIQPSLVLNFCIALQGIFPSRN
ncbi:MAG TPA: tail fiber protein [Pyrinomonadaceae bacterium]|nr:tail fiber protein [Pyrinomonadaceae bacterium]